MDDHDLKELLGATDIHDFDDNRRKETLNLAVAEFEKNQKNKKSFQGFGFLNRLMGQEQTNRRNNMSFSNKKLVYGGVATACVALLVYSIFPLMNPMAGREALSNFVGSEAAKVKQEAGPAMVMADAAVAPAPMAEKRVAAPAADAKVVNAPAEFEGAAVGNAAPAPASVPVMAAQGASRQAVMGGLAAFEPSPLADHEVGRDKFSHEDQNPIKQVAQDPISTFSIDVDTASYAFVRQSLETGVLPQADAVRVEEMVNYFDYAYPLPVRKDDPFRASVVVKTSPWNAGKKLVTIGIKGFDAVKAAQPDSNLVFLLDTSGSMNDPKKLPLLKQSLSMLLDSLKPTDKVAIVVYAGSAGVVLPPTVVANKGVILAALQNLQAGGSTAGGEGIRLAYQMAETSFDKAAINRVVLATDGDFNVGITNPDELQGFVERERAKGIFLSVLGFGVGNYNDAMMQKLAQNGNGVAAYIDTLNEARKVLVQEASAALFTIAKDVKIQVEFNPATVSEYRLVGYETRALKTEDFNNDKVDAGDIGAGAEVTAMYEITPVGGARAVDDRRYAPVAAAPKATAGRSSELGFLKIRYKLPSDDTSKLMTLPISSDGAEVSPELVRETNWAEAVAGFAQLLKGGKYTGALTYDDVIKLAEANKGDDKFGYRAEFINLVYKAKTASGLPSQGGSPYGGGGPDVPGEPYAVPSSR